jgi:pimeloyl-ACP methyl ester carboxylesterase
MSMMLANHGFAQATFMGHSFGTFWMSYMVKYGQAMIAGLVFIDPVCFCLYDSLLTQRTVYNPPDPGDSGYLVKTDMMVNWSIQRNFSWVQGNLFVEDIPDDIPVAVFISGNDRVAPCHIQKDYLQTHRDCKVQSLEHYYYTTKTTADAIFNVHDKTRTNANPWETQDLSVMIFDGYDHGLWLLHPSQTMPPIVHAMEALTRQASQQVKQ